MATPARRVRTRICTYAGKDNIVADLLSRAEAKFEQSTGEAVVRTVYKNKEEDPTYQITYAMSRMTRDESVTPLDGTDRVAMATVFASSNSDDSELEKFPRHPALIEKYQKTDKNVKQQIGNGTYKQTEIENVDVWTYDGKLVVPQALQQRIIAWYHLYLRHPGETRMEATLRKSFYWPSLSMDVKRHVKTCPQCQKCKKRNVKYGKLPEKDMENMKPWNRVNVDLIGPLNIKAKNGSFALNALTMIDPVTGWFEIVEIPERTAETVATAFDHNWLSRYPRPQYIGFDNGGENKGLFRLMIANYGIKRKPTSSHNPQANAIVERVHGVLNDMLRTFELEELEIKKDDPWTEFLTSCAFAIRSTYHSTLDATPAQVVFGRDMILPISWQANWEQLRARRQEMISHNNARENATRIEHEYKEGDKVLYRKHGTLRKLSAPRRGPYTVTRVYTNGTLRIKRGAISERANIRHIWPFNKQDTSE